MQAYVCSVARNCLKMGIHAPVQAGGRIIAKRNVWQHPPTWEDFMASLDCAGALSREYSADLDSEQCLLLQLFEKQVADQEAYWSARFQSSHRMSIGHAFNVKLRSVNR